MKKLYKRFVRHIRAWNKWRKGCLNSRLYKFLVLIGFIVSPTLEIHKAWCMEE